MLNNHSFMRLHDDYDVLHMINNNNSHCDDNIAPFGSSMFAILFCLFSPLHVVVMVVTIVVDIVAFHEKATPFVGVCKKQVYVDWPLARTRSCLSPTPPAP